MSKDRSGFSREVHRLDGGVCIDLECPCNRIPGTLVDAHHIKGRTYTDSDDPKWGCLLCRLWAHDRATNGYYMKDKNGRQRRVSARQYMIRVLRKWQGQPNFRWKEALEWLKSNEARKKLSPR